MRRLTAMPWVIVAGHGRTTVQPCPGSIPTSTCSPRTTTYPYRHFEGDGVPVPREFLHIDSDALLPVESVTWGGEGHGTHRISSGSYSSSLVPRR